MPVKGNTQMTLESIRSLRKNTRGNYRLIIVCDHDDDVAGHIMMETSEVPYVNSEEHGFAATCNLGASYGQASEILFLNSDILIEDPNWLIILESELTHPEVGVVGPKLLYFLS